VATRADLDAVENKQNFFPLPDIKQLAVQPVGRRYTDNTMANAIVLPTFLAK
jgi:hypothetical protein